ncbi:N-terminal kinase [Cordyceps militaris]|uniref:N-terminal kinase n=1 Tax=Cordyceps militaris TaxID=73501 RepID=A0A2H4SPQ9_CORMI|nr:N-terminal kinase [Cordyceps militaris]
MSGDCQTRPPSKIGGSKTRANLFGEKQELGSIAVHQGYGLKLEAISGTSYLFTTTLLDAPLSRTLSYQDYRHPTTRAQGLSTMDFLKSAVASAMAKGPPFPYSFGDKVDVDESIWNFIFSFDVTAHRGLLPLARNGLRKLRTIRHPGVIKVLDTVETETYIYIATERVVPLRWHVRRKSLSPETIKWGLHGIARTLKFINSDASSIHGCIKVGSVYTSESGEWKLGGFEILSSVKEDESTIYTYGSLAPDSARYSPPEVVQGGWDVIKKNPHSAVDAFNYGVLIYEVFNGDYNGHDSAGQTRNVPPTMHSSYKRLCNANPKARISVSTFLDQGSRRDSFFDTPLIKLTEDIDNLGIKSEEEREQFLEYVLAVVLPTPILTITSDLEQVSDDFPEDFFIMKVLPELMKSVEFGGGGPKAISVVLKIASKLSQDDFETKMVPFIVRMFGNPDRAIRVCLLDSLPLIIDQLPQKIVNDKIFPQIVTGFVDAAPIVREQTLKSVLVLITKLSDRTINGELLKHLAKAANDEQPGIRTNTTICLGKIAKHLGPGSRSKVLIAAFTRSMRDPFVHARNAALMSLAATLEYFTEEDCATRILPVLCPLLMDKEKLVRDQASRAMDTYVAKIKKATANMPDSVLPPTQIGDSQAARMSTPQPTAGSQGWTGWAISSFTNKMSTAAGEMQTTNGSAPSPKAPSSPAADGCKPTSSASTLHRQVLASPPASTAAPSPTPSAVAEELYGDDDAGGWGDMDDVDDDAGWGEAASQPAAKSAPVTASATPFDEGEPDFAGWLAAQSQKKPGGKALPKGLVKAGSAANKVPVKPAAKAKPVAGSAAKKVPVKPTAKAKPVAAKKIDLAPKADDDDDGWGDSW